MFLWGWGEEGPPLLPGWGERGGLLVKGALGRPGAQIRLRSELRMQGGHLPAQSSDVGVHLVPHYRHRHARVRRDRTPQPRQGDAQD